MRTARRGFRVKKVIHSFRNLRFVEYKTREWKLADDRKSISFIYKKGIGLLKPKGTRDLQFFQISQIKRVRLIKRADDLYVQFCVDVDRKENTELSDTTIGLDGGGEGILHRFKRS
jgi:putative transposase